MYFWLLVNGDVLIVMVGLGIGVVLFCGFLYEWWVCGVCGCNWLFFGE